MRENAALLGHGGLGKGGLRQGWCPGVLKPMLSGDGYLVRVRPKAGALSLDASRAIAALAAIHGNGLIDLTGRANLQIRGVSEAALAPLGKALADRGLVDASIGLEQVRNILVSPLHGLDPTCAPLDAIASALEARLASDTALHALPGKFSFVIDGGGAWPLHDARSDVVARALSPDGPWTIAIDGESALVIAIEAAAVVDTMTALAHAFLALSSRLPEAGRMADRVRCEGAGRVFEAAGLTAGAGRPNAIDPAMAAPEAPRTGLIESAGANAVVALGAPFGAIAAEALSRLIQTAEAAGAQTLRLSPWRTVAIPFASRALAIKVLAAGQSLGFIANPRDPRLRIVACPGKPACARGATAAREDAAKFADRLAVCLTARLAAQPFPATAIHVSGCAKGCAHPARAAITLTGNADFGGYDFIIDGRAGEAPEAKALSVEAAAQMLLEAMRDAGSREPSQ